MATLEYPADHFVDTPPLGAWVVAQARRRVGVPVKWQIPLEVIARYESDWNPYVEPGACEDCRGMMQLSTGMYSSAYRAGLIKTIDYRNPIQAVELAIRYIRSELPGYGGYGSLEKLLARDDRGPGLVLRTWIEHPDWGVAKLRPYYRGY
jgi:soluble lytic murein transglycosylase-like protein